MMNGKYQPDWDPKAPDVLRDQHAAYDARAVHAASRFQADRETIS
jgi:hypothetical protein